MDRGYRILSLALILAVSTFASVRGQPPCRSGSVDSSGLQLVNLDAERYPLATCNDGTTAFFYLRRARQSPNWVIYLEGGELCATAEACEKRRQAAPWQTSANASAYCAPLTGRTLLDRNVEKNPRFFSWNHVYVPYCTSDLHLGRTVSPPFSGAKGKSGSFVFRGAFVIESVIQELQGRGLRNGSEATVLFAGELFCNVSR